jgi:hypothetical protein
LSFGIIFLLQATYFAKSFIAELDLYHSILVIVYFQNFSEVILYQVDVVCLTDEIFLLSTFLITFVEFIFETSQVLS